MLRNFRSFWLISTTSYKNFWILLMRNFQIYKRFPEGLFEWKPWQQNSSDNSEKSPWRPSQDSWTTRLRLTFLLDPLKIWYLWQKSMKVYWEMPDRSHGKGVPKRFYTYRFWRNFKSKFKEKIWRLSTAQENIASFPKIIYGIVQLLKDSLMESHKKFLSDFLYSICRTRKRVFNGISEKMFKSLPKNLFSACITGIPGRVSYNP